MHAITEAASPSELVCRMAPRSVPRPARRPLYTLMLWLVALLSALMPVLYLGLIAALAWLGYHYYANWAPGDGHLVLLALAWLAPGFILSVLILFLLKPLFAPRITEPEAVRLSPDDEPALVAAVRASAPSAAAFYDWGGGLVWIDFDPADDAHGPRVRSAVALAGGHATLMRADHDVRARVEVFQPQPAAVSALSRRLKDSFDPQGILNPGRMYAGI